MTKYSSLRLCWRRVVMLVVVVLTVVYYVDNCDIGNSETLDSETCRLQPAALVYSSLSLVRQHSISYRYNNTIIELGIIIQPKSCPKNSDLLIIVISKGSDFAVRAKLRESWIKEARINHFAVYFLLGIEDSSEELVEREAAEHKDIILTDVQERYENLPLKTFIALVWKYTYCPQTTWLLKLDVDTDVHVDNLNRLLNLKAGMKNIIFGQMVQNLIIERNSNEKWFVPVEAFPNKHVPDYLTGGAYLMSSDVPRKLTAAHMLCAYPYITVEDMYFTGILAEAAHVRRERISEAYLFPFEPPFLHDFPYFCAERHRALQKYLNISVAKTRTAMTNILSLSHLIQFLEDVIC